MDDPDGLLLCRFCHAPITHTREALGNDGEQRLARVNPHGVHFELSRYQSAPGCDIRGKPTLEATWFSGFTWQLALCSDCHEHLGWYYERRARDAFFGLIADKLLPHH